MEPALPAAATGIIRKQRRQQAQRPTHTRTSSKTLEAGAQLRDYAKRVGGKAFGSDAGFAIGSGERLKCPDASWASPKTIASIPSEDLDRFWPASPDVGIEVKSHTDNFADTVEKVEMYRDRGSEYAVAIDPQTRDVQERATPPEGLVLDFDAIIALNLLNRRGSPNSYRTSHPAPTPAG